MFVLSVARGGVKVYWVSSYRNSLTKAMWDGHGEHFMVPRATPKGAKASLPSGSYTSGTQEGH